MLRPASPSDLPEITRLLVAANPTPYDIGKVAAEKVFGAGAFGETVATVCEENGVIAGVAVRCGRYLRLIAVHPGLRRRGIGSSLLDAAVEGHSAAGGRPAPLVSFAEPGNYFTPGVIETDSGTSAFFAARGFVETSWTTNVEATILPETMPAGVQRVTSASAATTLAFIEREFGRLWRFEAELALCNDPPTLFTIEKSGEIAGFSAHDANNRGLGAFGPTGVARTHRGRGFGTALLAASLADLRRLGHEKAIIPWTDAVSFYERACGARAAARFVTCRRNFPSTEY